MPKDRDNRSPEERAEDIARRVKRGAEIHGWPEDEFFRMVIGEAARHAFTKYPNRAARWKAFKESRKEVRRRVYERRHSNAETQG